MLTVQILQFPEYRDEVYGNTLRKERSPKVCTGKRVDGLNNESACRRGTAFSTPSIGDLGIVLTHGAGVDPHVLCRPADLRGVADFNNQWPRGESARGWRWHETLAACATPNAGLHEFLTALRASAVEIAPLAEKSWRTPRRLRNTDAMRAGIARGAQRDPSGAAVLDTVALTGVGRGALCRGDGEGGGAGDFGITPCSRPRRAVVVLGLRWGDGGRARALDVADTSYVHP